MAANFPYRPQTLVVFAVPCILAFGGALDIVLLCFFTLVRNWEAFLTFIPLYIDIAVVVGFLKLGAAFFTLAQTLRYVICLTESSSLSGDFPVKPMIFPCRTSHTRLFPKTHSFSYSYLWVGIPIGWKSSVGGMISSDDSSHMSPWYMGLLSLKPTGAWYTVNGDDYLGRGHAADGLEEKLRNYLQGQGIDPKEYPYAYLLTAPKFLGYASNPVSVWNLYSASKELKAFILEVNNTFDERHIYFVKPNPILSTSASPNPNVPPKLVNTWPKDFYVSTFNSRAGSYSISANDPLFPSMSGPGVVNTTITLKSAHASLVARIFSTSPAIDPATMSLWSKTKFLMAWWWVGLATFPRTVIQALSLLLKRKVPWVFRPEPRRDSMPRLAGATEVMVESIFRKYLRSLVETCDRPIVLNYSPAGLVHGKDETMLSQTARLADGNAEVVEINVLTPSFYSRYLHYTGDIAEALTLEHESDTIAISDLELLSKLKPKLPAQTLNPFEHPRLWVIQNLRNNPIRIDNSKTSPSPSSIVIDTKRLESAAEKPVLPAQLSPFESFILKSSSPEEKSEYASRVLKLFISEYIAFGWIEVLDLEIFLFRSRVAWVVAGWLVNR